MRKNVLLLAVMLLAGCGVPPPTGSEAGPLQAGMVAGLQRPLEILATRYHERTGVAIAPTFADKTQLAQQLRAGAPYDLLIAESGIIGDLTAAGKLDSVSVRPLVFGRLAVMTAPGGTPPADLRDLTRSPGTRIGIPDPEQTIYGSAARAACRKLGIWQALQPRLVLARTAAQAAVYAERGEVAASFVPLAGAIDKRAPHYLVPDELYPPIVHSMALTAGTAQRAAADAFLAFLRAPENRAVWEQYGFSLP